MYIGKNVGRTDGRTDNNTPPLPPPRTPPPPPFNCSPKEAAVIPENEGSSLSEGNSGEDGLACARRRRLRRLPGVSSTDRLASLAAEACGRLACAPAASAGSVQYRQARYARSRSLRQALLRSQQTPAA